MGEGELGHLLDGGVGGDVELGSIREGSGVDSGLRANERKLISAWLRESCKATQMSSPEKHRTRPSKQSWKLEMPFIDQNQLGFNLPFRVSTLPAKRYVLVMAEVAYVLPW